MIFALSTKSVIYYNTRQGTFIFEEIVCFVSLSVHWNNIKDPSKIYFLSTHTYSRSEENFALLGLPFKIIFVLSKHFNRRWSKVNNDVSEIIFFSPLLFYRDRGHSVFFRGFDASRSCVLCKLAYAGESLFSTKEWWWTIISPISFYFLLIADCL